MTTAVSAPVIFTVSRSDKPPELTTIPVQIPAPCELLDPVVVVRNSTFDASSVPFTMIAYSLASITEPDWIVNLEPDSIIRSEVRT